LTEERKVIIELLVHEVADALADMRDHQEREGQGDRSAATSELSWKFPTEIRFKIGESPLSILKKRRSGVSMPPHPITGASVTRRGGRGSNSQN
jgi:hypothetical protein